MAQEDPFIATSGFVAGGFLIDIPADVFCAGIVLAVGRSPEWRGTYGLAAVVSTGMHSEIA